MPVTVSVNNITLVDMAVLIKNFKKKKKKKKKRKKKSDGHCHVILV
jgi:hypothetical protein